MALALLVIFVGSFIFVGYWFYHKSHNYVVYQRDNSNTCSWSNGKITSSTIAGQIFGFSTAKVKKSNEAALLAAAAAKGQCWYRQ